MLLPRMKHLVIYRSFFHNRRAVMEHCRACAMCTIALPHVAQRSFSSKYINPAASSRFVRCEGLPSYKIARKQYQDEIVDSRFPWEDSFEISKDLTANADMILETLGPLISEERKERIAKVCDNRTFNVLPILEYPYDWGNVAAVCRSSDAMGCGAVHIVRSENDRYKQSTRTSAGAEKWLDIQLFSSTEKCLQAAKDKGFQVVVTCLHENAVPPGEIDWSKPTAIVFGSELEGVTEEAIQLADVKCTIPIDGFVESYNISVAAALMLWEARRGRLASLGNHGDLSEYESKILQAIMYLRNKGVFKQYAASLLKRAPPTWQMHRGDWSSKEFEYEEDEQQDGSDPKSYRHRPCQLWDGNQCWGEEYVYQGNKVCRYAAEHRKGVNTLNKEKLKQQCQKAGLSIPQQFK